MDNPIKIAMWSGPRNISTAMMRSFENRPDTVVEDEPFYAHYLVKTGVAHPSRMEIIESQENNWDKVSQRLVGEIPNEKTVWYQKHMAQHNIDGCNLSWIKELVNCFLIRDPKEVILSFSKKFELSSSEQLGFTQQLYLFQALKNEMNQVPIVIDSKNILLNPRRTLSIMCDKIGIPFMDEMLTWPPGPRMSDGVWAKHWYQNVEASTGFTPFSEKQIQISNKYSDILNECVDAYNFLNQYSIK